MQRVTRTPWFQATALFAVTLAATLGCVGKPAYRCSSNSSCIAATGSPGVCDDTGNCDFSQRPDTSPDASDASAEDLADAGAGDDLGGSADATAADACGVDLVGHCYRCAPKTALQILTSCTAASCVPFDDQTRLMNLLPDGAVPPLPTR